MLFSKSERRFISVLGQLIDCNPFLPERMDLEKSALGKSFVAEDANWNLDPAIYRRSENVKRICERSESILDGKKGQLKTANEWSEDELRAYADLVDYVLFSRLAFELADHDGSDWDKANRSYGNFKSALENMQPARLANAEGRSIPHLYATYFQIYRAFRNIFDHLLGSSTPIIKLRADVWKSIFSHDVRRYRNRLYLRMSDFSTLITGPSGSGKELVARAIGLSSYVPFSEKQRRFEFDEQDLFTPINLSALSPTLVESELFGHTKGAFTGAVASRKGWLESCPEWGAVFLDEIGDLDPGIQVKLLRVLQERTFQRLGETSQVPFCGKIIAATNVDLSTSMDQGGFRSDFYYRICSDQIRTPSLVERCCSNPAELHHLVGHLIRRILDHDDSTLTAQLCEWIEAHLGPNYPWPGNVRELEQCVRSWLIRREYLPASPTPTSHELTTLLQQSTMTADELVALYCRAKHEQLGSYLAVGQLLKLDRRTVKARIDG